MSRIPDDVRTLRQVIKELQGEVADLKRRSPFSNTGLSPDGTGGLTLQGVPLNPFIPAVANAEADTFSVSTTFAQKASVGLTVPGGCSRVAVTATGWIFARNPNTTGGVDGTGTDALWCLVRVVAGGVTTTSKTHGQGISGNGGFTTATTGLSHLQTGLTAGGTVTLSVWAASSMATLASSADNTAALSASVTWLR